MKTKKGQHYLLSAEARTMSLMQIMRLSDDEAFELFKNSRWTDGEPVCPCCSHKEHYWIGTRKQWRCKDCNHTFSVTSATIFANHKLPLTHYLAAIALYSNCAKSMSALQLSRDLDVQYKTAFVLAHKLREAMLDDDDELMTGEVELDGCYVNKHVRPKNHIANRVDRRLKRNQNPNKRAVMVIRQRGEAGEGAVKTRTFLTRSENQQTAFHLAVDNIDRSAVIFADEHNSYDVLHATLRTKRVMHAQCYRGPEGENTNQAESFFARFRRMQYGQNHRMDNKYMDRYANEAAYREDTRRRSNGDIFVDIMTRCAQTPVSRDFCGYWQGNSKMGESLAYS